MGNEQSEGFEAYYESGVLYPSQSETVESEKLDEKLSFKYGGTDFTVTYAKTNKYPDDVSWFLQEKDYDIYSLDQKIDVHVFRNTGAVKKLFVYENELNHSSQIVYDFSESSLKSAAETILVDLYGNDINKYLES